MTVLISQTSPRTGLCIMMSKSNHNENVAKLSTPMSPISLILKMIALLKSYGHSLRVKNKTKLVQDHLNIRKLYTLIPHLNILAKYFASVFTCEDVTNIPSLEGESDSIPGIPPIHINTEGVFKLLLILKCHKAAGSDNLPSRFFKEVAAEISPSLSMIFQASLDQGIVHDVWKLAFVVLVYKKGSRQDPSNYRPISLTCHYGI